MKQYFLYLYWGAFFVERFLSFFVRRIQMPFFYALWYFVYSIASESKKKKLGTWDQYLITQINFSRQVLDADLGGFIKSGAEGHYGMIVVISLVNASILIKRQINNPVLNNIISMKNALPFFLSMSMFGWLLLILIDKIYKLPSANIKKINKKKAIWTYCISALVNIAISLYILIVR